MTYEDAVTYYDNRKSEFMKPKKVRVQYLVVEKAPFEPEVKITEREIKAEYRDNESRYKDENGKLKPFEEVKKDIEKDLKAAKADEMASKRAQEIFAFYRPQRMKEQALKYGLTLRVSHLFARGETIDDYMGDSLTFAHQALRTKLGEVSDTFSTDKGYCVLSPIQVVEEAVADFEDVAEETAEKAMKNKADSLANRIAYELYRQVREKTTVGKKDFETACKELGLDVEESGYFRRDDFEIEKVGATGRQTLSIFENEPGKIGYPTRVPKGTFLYVISEVKPPSDEEFAKDKDSYYDTSARETAGQAFAEWSTALWREANVKRSLPVAPRKAAK